MDIKFSKIFLALIGFAVLSHTATYAQSGDYTLKGKIKNWKDNRQVVLSYFHDGTETTDTTTTTNGRFTFQGTLAEPLKVTLYLISPGAKGVRDGQTFYIEPGVFQLTGVDSLKKAVLKGTPVTRDFEAYTAQLDPLIQEVVALRLKAMKIPEAERETASFKQLEQRFRVLQDSVQATRIAFVQANPESFIALVALMDLSGFHTRLQYEPAQTLFQTLDSSVKETPSGKQLEEALTIAGRTTIGRKLLDFTSLDTQRKPLKLSDVVSKSKITLVDFWAAWCKPCRAENPNVVRAYKAFHDKGFNILSVSLDQSEAAWKKAIKVDGMPWYHVSSLQYWNEPVAELFGIKSVPDNFLLDKDGKIIGRALKGDNLYQAIEKYLATLEVSEQKSLDIQKTLQAGNKRFHAQKTAAEKAQVFHQLFDSLQGKDPKIADYKRWMQRDLARQYARENNEVACKQWIQKISDANTQTQATIFSSEEFLAAGNRETSLQMVQSVLDSLLEIDVKLSSGDALRFYTMGLPIYLKAAPEDANRLRYLEAYYETNGKHFPTDIGPRLQNPDTTYKVQLFYQYAQLEAEQGDAKTVAQVLVNAFENGSVPEKMQKQVLDEFSNLPHFNEHYTSLTENHPARFEAQFETLLKQPDIHGKVWGPSAFDGQYVLVDFWGSWCIPCRASHPHLTELYDKYKDQGLEIIGIALESGSDLDKARASQAKAIEYDGISWIHFLNNEIAANFDAVKAFGVGVFPTKLLLDKNGNLIAQYIGGAKAEELDQKLKDIFGF